MLERIIPSSGELLPTIGLGTWQTFDVQDTSIYPQLREVVEVLADGGGTLIDSSPMYGQAEEVIGHLTADTDIQNRLFYATKVWTVGPEEGKKQIRNSFEKLNRKTLDLLQIHNLTDWETHLPLLRSMKDAGEIRYIGLTHYTDDSHEVLEKIITREPVDFIQFNYSITARNAEDRLLRVAADLGVATLINRPFGQGALFKKVMGRALPPWAAEAGIDSWAAYFLKYILAHPAVTCVIPATHNPLHAVEIVAAGTGTLPDNVTRENMLTYLGLS